MPKIIDHNQYRKELLQACFRLFADKSHDSLTMRQIAAELGVSTGTLYHYFASKEDIFVQLVDHIAVESLRYSENTVERLDSLEARLDSFLRFIKGYEERLLQTLLILNDFRRSEKAKGRRYDPRHSIEALGHEEWTAQYLRTEDRHLVRHFLYAIQGVVLQRYLDGGKTDLDEHLELAKSMFLTTYQQRKKTTDHGV